jgi:predicted nucleotidyltransferase
MNEKQISLLAAFAAAKVEFAVVGGVAVNMHGYVRATNDLDIFIRPTVENARAAFGALFALGAPMQGLEPNDLLDDERNLRFGPEEDHIDILASIGEMPFDQVWRNRIEIEIEGLAVPFISMADLIANKRQVGRLRDLADVEELMLVAQARES